jgi:hypothetical protein
MTVSASSPRNNVTADVTGVMSPTRYLGRRGQAVRSMDDYVQVGRVARQIPGLNVDDKTGGRFRTLTPASVHSMRKYRLLRGCPILARRA